MTDRIRQLTITLDRDYRDDDVALLVNAIKMIRGVAEVELHVVTATDSMARAATRVEVGRKLHAAIDAVLFERTDKP